MTTQKVTMGPLEQRFWSWARLKSIDQVRTGDMAKALGVPLKKEAKALHILSSKGMIVKLWRGLYLVPPEVPLAQKWLPHPGLIIQKYMQSLKAKFFISGPAMFNWHGFSQQTSNWFTVYNNKVSKKICVCQYHINFVKTVVYQTQALSSVQASRTKKLPSHNVFVSHSGAAELLFDAVHNHTRYNTLPKSYGWLGEAIRAKKIRALQVSRLAQKFGNTSSRRRVGCMLEKLGVSRRITRPLLKLVEGHRFLTPLDPSSRRGKINLTWGVIDNVNSS